MDDSNLQEMAHPEGFDYESGSPHLKHTALRDRIAESLRLSIRDLVLGQGSCRVLEVGAGHGDFTDVMLGAGAEVVVTEMSGPSAGLLSARYEANDRVTVVHDPDGQWLAESDEEFGLVACLSVLHHIPDYLGFLRQAFEATQPGGAFISWQDPLWYPRRTTLNLTLDKASYFGWRVTKGSYARGALTRVRRLRGVYDESNPADMSEYHVVRQGVDEEAIVDLAARHFGSVELIKYWSTQSRLLHDVGSRSGHVTTFGILASGRSGPDVTG